MWNKRQFVKALKTIKAIRTKRVDGVPYYKVNLYHPIIWGLLAVYLSKDIIEQMKKRSVEFGWLRDYRQEREDKNNVE